MDMAKSLFGSRDHEGYVGKDDILVSLFKLNILFIDFCLNFLIPRNRKTF